MAHDFSLISTSTGSHLGITLFTWTDNDLNSLNKRLLEYCSIRKYRSKADYWLGIGCLKDSGRYVDTFVYSSEIWEHNEVMEKEVNNLFEGKSKGNVIDFGKKLGRNDTCRCGSGLKFKRCCGR